MPNNRVKNAGFGVIGVLVVVLAVLVVGFIGWRVYDAGQQGNTSSKQQDANEGKDAPLSTEPAKDQNEGYVVIKEWGVRFKPVEGLRDVVYLVGDGAQTATLSTVELSKYGENCSVTSTSHTPLGRLHRTLGTKDNAVRMSTLYAAQIGDYYYQLAGPQSACSADASADQLQTEGINLMKQSMQSLEAAK